jgi:hypothetical protein
VGGDVPAVTPGGVIAGKIPRPSDEGVLNPVGDAVTRPPGGAPAGAPVAAAGPANVGSLRVATGAGASVGAASAERLKSPTAGEDPIACGAPAHGEDPTVGGPTEVEPTDGDDPADGEGAEECGETADPEDPGDGSAEDTEEGSPDVPEDPPPDVDNGDETSGKEDDEDDGNAEPRSGTLNPPSASLIPALVECIADPVTPDDADFASPSRSGN